MSNLWKRIAEVALDVAVVAVFVIATALAEEIARAVSGWDADGVFPPDRTNQ